MKTVKGSAIYNDDGTYIFTPYEEGKPENVNWLPLATVENGKLECSKKKIRMVLTCDRTELGDATSKFARAYAQLVARSQDKRVQKLYIKSAEKRPHELKEEAKKVANEVNEITPFP